jgi:predicted enzyme related to lactoylglutathione lyase
VDDLAVSTSKARSLGAQIIKENVPVPNMDKFSIIADPTGAVLGLWEAQTK